MDPGWVHSHKAEADEHAEAWHCYLFCGAESQLVSAEMKGAQSVLMLRTCCGQIDGSCQAQDNAPDRQVLLQSAGCCHHHTEGPGDRSGEHAAADRQAVGCGALVGSCGDLQLSRGTPADVDTEQELDCVYTVCCAGNAAVQGGTAHHWTGNRTKSVELWPENSCPAASARHAAAPHQERSAASCTVALLAGVAKQSVQRQVAQSPQLNGVSSASELYLDCWAACLSESHKHHQHLSIAVTHDLNVAHWVQQCYSC